ncbi:MAG: caspase family protein [Acidobacteria bacterium]|nr:caspase family protein [Acidobacteriota bacterium]
MWRRLTGVLACCCFAAGVACAQGAAARPAADPNKYAVILSGASGEEEYAKRFAQWTAALRRALVERFGFDEARVTVLSESPEGGRALKATAEEVRRTFQTLRSSAGPESTVFVFLIGHGTYDGRQAKFGLVGPDLTANEYAELLDGLTVKRVVVLNMASASGEFIKPLSGRNRVVVAATRSGQEQNATRFPEFFIEALTSRESDADQNGRVSIFEAFDYAARMTAERYKRDGRLATEHAMFDDSGDGVGHATAEGGDGVLARTTYLDSLTAEQAAATAEAARLLRERERLEVEVEQLKARKTSLPESEYEAELERIFVSLAKVNRSIKRGAQ